MRLDLSLSETEMQELQALLCSASMPESCLDLPGLDGFFAAVALTPGYILPSQWLPRVWDPERGAASPEFSDTAQAQRIVDLVMRYYNQVVSAVDSGEFKPLFHAGIQEDGSELIDAERWGRAFMAGVKLFGDQGWRAVVENHTELMSPMLMIGTDRGRQKLRESPDPERSEEAARRAIPAAIAELNATSSRCACSPPSRSRPAPSPSVSRSPRWAGTIPAPAVRARNTRSAAGASRRCISKCRMG